MIGSRPQAGAGSSRLSTLKTTGQLRAVAQIIRYPGYVDASRGKDIALLRLSTPLDLSGPKAKAIELVTAADANAGATAGGVTSTISGWGPSRRWSTGR